MSQTQTRISLLGAEPAKLHRSFAEGDKTTAIHLFGVKYGPELLELTRAQLDDVSEAAGLKPIYGLELRKMAKLSKYVTVS